MFLCTMKVKQLKAFFQWSTLLKYVVLSDYCCYTHSIYHTWITYEKDSVFDDNVRFTNTTGK